MKIPKKLNITIYCLGMQVLSNPEDAESDGIQSLKPHKFTALMGNLKAYIAAAGRM